MCTQVWGCGDVICAHGGGICFVLPLCEQKFHLLIRFCQNFQSCLLPRIRMRILIFFLIDQNALSYALWKKKTKLSFKSYFCVASCCSLEGVWLKNSLWGWGLFSSFCNCHNPPETISNAMWLYGCPSHEWYTISLFPPSQTQIPYFCFSTQPKVPIIVTW